MYAIVIHYDAHYWYLTSSNSETYLEQKSGFRILWTEEGESIIIWFVAKHKEVSRLMKLIDDSKSRSARQQMPEALVAELQNDSPRPRKKVMLDVFGNAPLKLYDFGSDSIDEITKKSWSPRLHLTDEERDVVEAEGTILVLGRSGTGKVRLYIFQRTSSSSIPFCNLTQKLPSDCLHL